MRIDIGKEVKEIVEEMTMQAIENQEEFIFETIRPYCENVLQIKINKEELKQILLNSVQKQQPCDDAISRQEVISEIDKYIEKVQSTGSRDDFTSFQELVVKQLPPVTPKRSTGKWKIHPKGGYAHLVCSNCLSYAPLDCKTNYCPDCGACMEESEGDE